TVAGDRAAVAHVRRERRERTRLTLVLEELVVLNPPLPAFARVADVDVNDAGRIVERQRLEQRGVVDREGHRIDADTQPEGERDREREGGTPREQTETKSDVRKESHRRGALPDDAVGRDCNGRG